MTIGAVGHLVAFAAYGILTLLLAFSWQHRRVFVLLILASALTTVWAGLSLSSKLDWVPLAAVQLTEAGRDLGWTLFLVYILHLRTRETRGNLRRFNQWQLGVAVLGGLTILLALLPWAIPYEELPELTTVDGPLALRLAFAIVGLLLIEQIYRNAGPGERWALKYLCLGLGSLFAYDFYMYSEALLFRQIDADLWRARGFINALAVPLIAISVARNESWTNGIHVSRHVVFHSLTLVMAGLYLLIMASAGFFIRHYGGSWGGVLQVAFLVGTGLVLLVLLFSDTLRARFRVFLGKHFFRYKYDYREERNRFTRTLATGDDSIPERVIRALSALVHSKGGLLWMNTDEGRYELIGQWNATEPEPGHLLTDEDPLIHFISERHWVVDFDEYHTSPSLYGELALPPWVEKIPGAWLAIPLEFRDELIAILVLRHSDAVKSLNWEDRDLLKMAGQQAAAHLAQHQADQALMQARQFEAFNRLSAYIVHDLKNILAQQSLIVANAEKHKHNPAFVDDVIATVNHSVKRMTRLMEQMRSGMRGSHPSLLELGSLLREVAERRSTARPVPKLSLPEEPLCVEADREQLATVFGHLVQNAQEATPDNGKVALRLFRKGDRAIIEVEDTGTGMDAAFISERLFKPFDSTKGLTGMGIGVFESREYIRSLEGEICVHSTPGEGSLFRITLPLQECSNKES